MTGIKTMKPSSLVFLEVTPTVPRGKDGQRVIRSHVTRIQHQKRRESCRADQSDWVTKFSSAAASDQSTSSEDQVAPSDRISSASSSESTSPADAKNEESELPFFNASHPSQIKNSNVRKLVRSHVTKWQHKRRRKAATEAIDQLPSPPESTRTTVISDAPLPRLPVGPSEKLISKGAAAIRNVILDDPTNTVATAITRLGLDLRSVMVSLNNNRALQHAHRPQAHYFYMALDVHAPEFEAQYVYTCSPSSLARTLEHLADQSTSSYCVTGTCQRLFLPFLFTDPALTCAIVLIAIIHRMSLMGMKQHPPEILHLRGFVIVAVNQALQDPFRACSDQLIFAVANLAIFEAVFGSTEVYHVHMQGLVKMLRIRGGLPTLGFDGYLQKVLLWYDSNCANLVGCDPYLLGSEAPYPELGMKPDPGNFTVGLKVH